MPDHTGEIMRGAKFHVVYFGERPTHNYANPEQICDFEIGLARLFDSRATTGSKKAHNFGTAMRQARNCMTSSSLVLSSDDVLTRQNPETGANLPLHSKRPCPLSDVEQSPAPRQIDAVNSDTASTQETPDPNWKQAGSSTSANGRAWNADVKEIVRVFDLLTKAAEVGLAVLFAFTCSISHHHSH